MKRTASIVTALSLLLCLFNPTSAHAVWGCGPDNIQPSATDNPVVWQLECFGFVRMDAHTSDLGDHGVVHSEKWQSTDFLGQSTTIYVSDRHRRAWDYRIEMLTNTVDGVNVWCVPTENLRVIRAIVAVEESLYDPASQFVLGVDRLSGAVRIEMVLPQDGQCWYSRNR